jgi:DNA adenine methylase
MTALKSPFRYPGSKAKLLPQILSRLPEELPAFCDVFVGGGSVTIAVAESRHDTVLIINEADSCVRSFWQEVVSGPQDLIEKVLCFTPSVEAFYRLQEEKDSAFAGIALNRMAFAGILHASPIGGRNQTSRWTVGCRWNAQKLASDIMQLHVLLRGRTSVFGFDASFSRMWAGFVYADPPYYKQGKALYRKSVNHEQLAGSLQDRREGSWLLSYDDAPEIRRLYEGCRIEEVPVRYCGKGAKQTWESKKELLISS